MMSSTVQHLLCCIGDTTSVKPTQFLMERVLGDSQTDWRAITVEVESDKLAVAVEGLTAMGFAALRLFGGHQQAVGPLLLGSPVSARVVTSAFRSGQQWQCWDNIGMGMLKLIAKENGSLLWIQGENRWTRAFADSLVQSPWRPETKSGISIPILWTGAQSSDANAGDANSRITFCDDIQLVQSCLESRDPTRSVVIVAEYLANALDQVKSLNIPSGSRVLFVTPGDRNRPSDRMQSAARDVLVGCRCDFLAACEVNVAAEAYDINRWTGIDIDIDLLRDAYEEYVDF